MKDYITFIAVGNAPSLCTREVLLTVDVSKCIKRLRKFIKRPERFEERIVKQKMQTFETELGRKIIQRSQWKSFCTLLFA